MNQAQSIIYRRLLRVRGVVQGVGFRPWVYRTAIRHGLTGWVRNTSGSVEIDVEGLPDHLNAFATTLWQEAPELARVDSITSVDVDLIGYTEFNILESCAGDRATSVIPVDVATCPDCLKELSGRSDRRFGYPFINCTNCGPRFTIIQRIPYDRVNTTMASFEMCDRCREEYEKPSNRRFHAEPTACPDCGPRIWFEAAGDRLDIDPIIAATECLRDGKILAIKGLGGFHLACDATNDGAVVELRKRKGRIAKSFAVMVRDIAAAEQLCEMDETTRTLLQSFKRPIALAKKRQSNRISEFVAPGNRLLGLLLPYTPLHTLIMEQFGRPLVMTSGNLSEEPLVFTNRSARNKLAALADAFLMHNRDIQVPCDDSVVRSLPNSLVMVRRARGYVPESIEMPLDCEGILGTGAEQKSTFCLGTAHKAIPSQHIGDLDTVETFDYYRYAVDHLVSLLGCETKIIAHDLHPNYKSTHYALSRKNVELVGVQHHHAHIAACLAENGCTETCIGLALDGTGYGTNGTIWGGEILLASLTRFERIGHLKETVMPGGESAIRDPKRMAMAYLHASFGEEFENIAKRLGLTFEPLEARIIRHQIETGLNSPITSSAGRLFDAVSAAIGICRDRDFEGRPAIELEMAADEAESSSYPFSIRNEADMLLLNSIPAFKALVEEHLAGVSQATIAAKFHNSVVEMMVSTCQKARDLTGVNWVALSGGVFQNSLILTRLFDGLRSHGFDVLIHKLMPPNDACISLGQVAVAAAILRKSN